MTQLNQYLVEPFFLLFFSFLLVSSPPPPALENSFAFRLSDQSDACSFLFDYYWLFTGRSCVISRQNDQWLLLTQPSRFEKWVNRQGVHLTVWYLKDALRDNQIEKSFNSHLYTEKLTKKPLASSRWSKSIFRQCFLIISLIGIDGLFHFLRNLSALISWVERNYMYIDFFKMKSEKNSHKRIGLYHFDDFEQGALTNTISIKELLLKRKVQRWVW